MAVEPNRWAVIYNPKAGTKNAQKRWKSIRDYMDEKGVQYDYVQSEGYGSVERLSRTMANNGYRTIVVVGGDGAMNDALNGIMFSDAEDKNSIAVGIIPNGIGNDFAKYWGLNSDDYKPKTAYGGCWNILLLRRRKTCVALFPQCRLYRLGSTHSAYHQ